MLKKDVLGGLVVGLVAVLLGGAVWRTIDRAGNVAEARGNGRAKQGRGLGEGEVEHEAGTDPHPNPPPARGREELLSRVGF